MEFIEWILCRYVPDSAYSCKPKHELDGFMDITGRKIACN